VDLAALRPNDLVTVYHGTDSEGFRQLANGIDALKVVSRLYGQKAHRGLFVSPDRMVASRFASDRPGVVLEMRVRAANLHGVSTDGEIRDREDTAFREEFPRSFRPSLSRSMSLPSEPRALFLGYLDPRQITAVWVRREHPHSSTGEMERLGRQEAMQRLGIVDWGIGLTSPRRLALRAFLHAAGRALKMPEGKVFDIIARATGRWGQQGFPRASEPTPESLAHLLRARDGFNTPLSEKAALHLARQVFAEIERRGRGVVGGAELTAARANPRQAASAKQPSRDLSGAESAGLPYWHITSNRAFSINSGLRPRHARMGDNRRERTPGIWLTRRPEQWVFWFGGGPLYAAEIVPSRHFRYSEASEEGYDEAPADARLLRVLPLQQAIEEHPEQFGSLWAWAFRRASLPQGGERLVARRGLSLPRGATLREILDGMVGRWATERLDRVDLDDPDLKSPEVAELRPGMGRSRGCTRTGTSHQGSGRAPFRKMARGGLKRVPVP
jgi:hypothetical protein